MKIVLSALSIFMTLFIVACTSKADQPTLSRKASPQTIRELSPYIDVELILEAPHSAADPPRAIDRE